MNELKSYQWNGNEVFNQPSRYQGASFDWAFLGITGFAIDTDPKSISPSLDRDMDAMSNRIAELENAIRLLQKDKETK